MEDSAVYASIFAAIPGAYDKKLIDQKRLTGRKERKEQRGAKENEGLAQ